MSEPIQGSMQATASTLRRPRPTKEESLLDGRFYFTDENGRLASSLGTQVHLTAEALWITPELSISLDRIESIRLVRRRGLPPRCFLEVVHVNPVTGGREALHLCKPDPVGIGLYRVAPLEELMRKIEDQRARTAPAAAVGATDGARLHVCEACGAEPAFYVGYTYWVGALLISYRSETRRRLHCRKHNALHGLGYYLVTALSGWIGIGIVAYPFAAFTAGCNLAPAFGKASYALGLLPTIVLAALLAAWLL